MATNGDLFRAVESAESQQAVIRIEESRGGAASTSSVICAHCGIGILAIGPVNAVVYDVALKCYYCGGLSTAEPWVDGRAVGFPHVVSLVGGTSCRAPLDLTKPVATMAGDSVDKRLSELKRLTEVRNGPGREITVDYLNALLAQGVGLLGEKHQRIYQQDRRLRADPRSKKQPHPLIRILDDTRDVIHGLANGEPRNARQAAMLINVLDLVDRWRHVPEGVKAIAKLKDGQEFWHNVVLFAVAQQLARFGNDVELYSTQDGARTADLRIVTAGIHSLHIEVKAPVEMVPPYLEIAPRDAERIVEATFSAAGTGSKGQLPPAHAGLLCIAGVSLSDKSRSNLRAALNRSSSTRPRGRISQAA